MGTKCVLNTPANAPSVKAWLESEKQSPYKTGTVCEAILYDSEHLQSPLSYLILHGRLGEGSYGSGATFNVEGAVADSIPVEAPYYEKNEGGTGVLEGEAAWPVVMAYSDAHSNMKYYLERAWSTGGWPPNEATATFLANLDELHIHSNVLLSSLPETLDVTTETSLKKTFGSATSLQGSGNETTREKIDELWSVKSGAERALATAEQLGMIGNDDDGTSRDEIYWQWYYSISHLYETLEAAKPHAQKLVEYNEKYQALMLKDQQLAQKDITALNMERSACKVLKRSGATYNPDTRQWTGGDQAILGYKADELRGKDYLLGVDKISMCPDGEWSKEDEKKLKQLQQNLKELKTAQAEGLGAAMAGAQEPTKRTFKEQCLLLSNIKQFIDYRHKLDNEGIRSKRLPYLTTSMELVNASSGQNINKQNVTSNACLMVHRSPWGFMNQLVADPSFARFFNIENKYLSQLQPMIKLYKVSTEDKSDEDEIEINFDNAFNDKFDAILGNTKKRGFGVGIKSFDFSYEGSDPFAVKKSIKAKLSLFAASFDDLLVDRGGYRYADLALKTGSGYKDKLSDRGALKIPGLQDLNFRLKAVIGWSLPPGGPIATDTENRRLRDAINNSFVTINLTPTIHEFDINEMGQVVFHINYLAYVDHFFDETSFNIFSDEDLAVKQIVQKNKFYEIHRDCSKGDAETRIDELKKEMKDEIYNDKRKQLQTIVANLLKYKMVYFKQIPTTELRAFNADGPYWNFDIFTPNSPPVNQSLGDAVQDNITTHVDEAIDHDRIHAGETPNFSDAIVSDLKGNQYIAWFYLSDLIDVVLQGIDDSLKKIPNSLNDSGLSDTTIASEKTRIERIYKNFKQLRILLGPIELRNSKKELEFFDANLGDLPISMSYFQDWLTDKTLKRENTVYSLPIFLKDLLNNLVRNFLNENKCFDLNIKQRVRVFQSTVTSYRDPSWRPSGNDMTTDEITEWIKQQGPGDSKIGNAKGIRLDMKKLMDSPVTSGHVSTPILRVMGERNSPINTRVPADTYNYMVFYAGRVQPQVLMNGDEGQDTAAGVFHFVLGKPNGIVKNIQLSKTEAPGLKEVRFEQEGYDGLMQLREVYDANITCYGVPNIVPGTYIYVDPRGFAPQSAEFLKDEVIVATTTGTKRVIDNKSLSRYGIGGYYMVTRAENKFAPGQCETEITAKWVAEIATRKSSGGHNGSPGPRKPAKCNTSS